MPFITNENGITINTIRRLPQNRYLAALHRILAQIKNGSKLNAVDSTQIGNKYTHCSWGLCSTSKEQWPDKEDRLFPQDQPLAILSQDKGQFCPFDQHQTRQSGPDGCFYHCRIFQNPNNRISREEAIRLYEIQIEKATK
jgi:hypothetical protein